MKRIELFKAMAGLIESVDRRRKSESLIIEGYLKDIREELVKLNSTLDRAMREPVVKNELEPDLFTQEAENKAKDDNRPYFTDRKPAKGKGTRSDTWIGLGATYTRIKNMGSKMTYTDVKDLCITRKMVMRYKESKKDRNHGNWYLLKKQAEELVADIKTLLK